MKKKIVGAETKKILYHRRNHDNNVIGRNMSRWPKVINIIITRHPIYFCNNKKEREKALFYVYEKLARYYRTKRKRKKAAFYAKIAIKNGSNTPVLSEILKEEKKCQRHDMH